MTAGFGHRPHQHCSAGHHIWQPWYLRSSRPGKACIDASKLHGTTADPCICSTAADPSRYAAELDWGPLGVAPANLQLAWTKMVHLVHTPAGSSPVQLPGVCIPLLHLALPLLNLRLPVLASRQAGHVGVLELAAAPQALQPIAPNTVRRSIFGGCVVLQLALPLLCLETQACPAASHGVVFSLQQQAGRACSALKPAVSLLDAAALFDLVSSLSGSPACMELQVAQIISQRQKTPLQVFLSSATATDHGSVYKQGEAMAS